MIESPEKKAIVSGIGISPIGRRTGIDGLDLTVDASQKAVADAGLKMSDIDGISTMGETPLFRTLPALKINPDYQGGGFDTGGLLSPLMSAFLAVAAGKARHVLVYRTVNMMNGSVLDNQARNAERQAKEAKEPGAPPPAPPPTGGGMREMQNMMTFHGYGAPNWLSMHALRHMHQYGTKKEHLGWLAVNSRKNAALNPLALYKEPFTIDDYMEARMISTPFNLLDCDVPLDGSVAFVVSHQDYAKDSPHPTVRAEAIGGSDGHGGWYRRDDYPHMAAYDAGKQLWSRTDLKPKDVDFAELYDGFSFLTLSWMEALNLVPEGQVGPYIDKATRIALDGELPVNTYGGQLSAGRMHGYWVVHEAVTQLRGAAGPRQIKKPAKVAAVAAGGGPIAGAVLLRRD